MTVSVEELQGSWEKLFCILAWRMCRDGLKITLADLAALPMDRILLIEGHSDTIEFRWVTAEQAQAIAAEQAEREGKVLDVPRILVPGNYRGKGRRS